MAEQSLMAGASRSQQQIACRRCGIQVGKVSSGHLYCPACAEERRLQTKRECEERRRRKAGIAAIGAALPCRRCGKEFPKTGANRRYCEQCSDAKMRSDKAKQAQRERAAKPEAARARSRRYYQRNRARILAASKARIESDPHARLTKKMGGLLWWCLRKQKSWRSWRELVPYSLEELVAHLERQFTAGMTWQNFGEWEIDHILPRRMFNYTSHTDPDFVACWALTNLRPLWKSENCAKGGRRLHLL